MEHAGQYPIDLAQCCRNQSERSQRGPLYMASNVALLALHFGRLETLEQIGTVTVRLQWRREQWFEITYSNKWCQ